MQFWRYGKWVMLPILFIFLLLCIYAYSLLTQEPDTFKIIWAVIRLEFSDTDLIRFNDDPERYLVSAQSKGTPFYQMMASKGWKLQDQLGAGLIFNKKDEHMLAVKRMWTRRYMIFTRY